METILVLYWTAVYQYTLRSRPIEKQNHFQTRERVGVHNHSIGLRSVGAALVAESANARVAIRVSSFGFKSAFRPCKLL